MLIKEGKNAFSSTVTLALHSSDIEGGTEPLFASCFHLENKSDDDNNNYPSIPALLNKFLTTETLGKYFDTKLLGL